MKAKEEIRILKAALRIKGVVAVQGEGELVVTAQAGDNRMIAVIEGRGGESTPGVDSRGDKVLALDAQELGQWLKLVEPLLKNGLGGEKLTITPQGGRADLRVGARAWSIAGLSIEAETREALKAEVEVTMDAADLLKHLGEVKDCVAGKEDKRTVLRQVHFVERDGRLGLEAANGYYMARTRLLYRERGRVRLDSTLPGVDWRFGPLIEALLSTAGEVQVRIAGTGGQGTVELAGGEFTVQVTAWGTFPDTAQIIPWRMIGAADSLLLDVGDILAALPEARMQTAYGPGKGTEGVLLYTEDGATLRVRGVASVLCSPAPAPLWGIHVNGKFLETLLKGSGRDLLQAKWDYNHPNGPLVLADDGDWIALLMPLWVNVGQEQSAGIARKEAA